MTAARAAADGSPTGTAPDPNRYPLLLDLTGRRVLVVGGGRLAARRVPPLLAAGADVHLVAPSVRPELLGRGVRVDRRGYQPADLVGAWLVHACTDNDQINAGVAADAAAAGVWCVRGDDAAASAAHVPAVTRTAGLTVAVGASGDPRRAAAVRDAIADQLADARLPLRHRRRRGGLVSLVGAGPGDPGLLTVLGRQRLAEADVVVTDQLVPRSLLETLPAGVEVVDAGKQPHRHNLTQEQICALLVDRARAGLRVVRFKGGDPFVFGRGGEEALACVRAGVRFEVVPGVSSAVAVPAYAGIPVTHRGLTQDLAVVSGHLDPAAPGVTVDWQALATGPGTIVLLMAVGTLERVCAELVERGRPAGTPAAVISHGTTPAERVVVADLAGLPAAAQAEQIGPPAVVVVGEVVRLREQLAWR